MEQDCGEDVWGRTVVWMYGAGPWCGCMRQDRGVDVWGRTVVWMYGAGP